VLADGPALNPTLEPRLVEKQLSADPETWDFPSPDQPVNGKFIQAEEIGRLRDSHQSWFNHVVSFIGSLNVPTA
jgi:hypothetical protein